MVAQGFNCRFCESQNLGKKFNAKRSSPICHSKSLLCHSERSEESKKNLVILSEAKYLNNNRDSSATSLPQNDNVGLDSSVVSLPQNDNVGRDSSRYCAQNDNDFPLDSAYLIK